MKNIFFWHIPCNSHKCIYMCCRRNSVNFKGENMSIKRFNFVKVGFLILLCFGIVLLDTNYSQATPLTDPEVSWGDSTANLTIDDQTATYYTDYYLDAEEFEDPMEAFCVENVGISDESYELIPVETPSDEDLILAAKIADQYFNDPDFRAQYTKEEVQIAIWEIVFDSDNDLDGSSTAFTYNTSDSDALDHIQEIVDSAAAGEFDFTGEPIALAHSPADGTFIKPERSQDYLVGVSVPDVDIMWLLGPAFIALGILGRKKSRSGFKTSSRTQSLC